MFAKVDPSLMFGNGDVESASLLGTAASSAADGANDSNDTLCPALSLSQRLAGFAFCLSMGWLLSFGAMGRVLTLLQGNPQPFVTFFTAGGLLSLISSCFLAGPSKQFSQMFDARRRLATVSLLGTMGATLFVAHWRGLSGHGQGPVLLLLFVLQIVAQGYYLLTYVPYGPELLSAACKNATKVWNALRNQESDGSA